MMVRKPLRRITPARSMVAGLVVMVAGLGNAAAVDSTRAQAVHSFLTSNMPLCFEVNRGQVDGSARFMARGAAYQFLISPTEAVVTLRKHENSNTSSERIAVEVPAASATQFRSVRLQFVGANPQAIVSGEKEMKARVNYFIGNDPSKWQAGVSLFERVRVEDIYPGIAVVHYGNQKELEYDFIIAPHADPSHITVRFTGADRVGVSGSGELVLTLGDEEIRQPKPKIYQTVQGMRKEIEGGYYLADDRTMKFRVGEYDQSLALTIDPVLSYSTFIGGAKEDIGWAVVVDASGDLYLSGETRSPQFYASAASFQTNLAGTTDNHGDAFIMKVDNSVTQLRYFTYLGGKTADSALALAVDGAGSAYLAGYTDSTNFPVRSEVFANLSGQANVFTGIKPVDAFVAKLDPSGSNLLFSTYIGGGAIDAAYGIALDSQTNVYVTGYTLSTNFPTRNTIRTNQSGNGDVFIAKLDIANTNLIYSALFGGTNQDVGADIATDATGKVFVTGYTSSTNFPVNNAVQSLLNNTTNASTAFDAFALCLDPALDSLVYSTFIGGTNDDFGFRLALDNAQGVYVTGATKSPDFVRSSTNLPSGVASNGIVADVMVVKLESTGARSYSAMFGGAGRDEGWDIAVDSSGSAWVVGLTASTRFPTNAANSLLRGTNSGGLDVFVSKLNPAGTALDFSAYFGGSKDDMGYGITLDPAGNAYVVGETSSLNFPTNDPGQFSLAGKNDAFVFKILQEPTIGISTSSSNIVVSWLGFSPELVLQSSTNLLVSNSWVNVTASRSFTNSQHSVILGATNSPNFFRLQIPQ